MKRESAEEVLARALGSLFDKGMPFEKISVKAICEECESSKTTFYKYFNDKYDLASWYLKGQMLETLGGFEVVGWRAAGERIFQTIAEKASFYKSVFRYSGQNSIQEFIYEYSEKSFRESLRRATGLDPLPKSHDYAIRSFMTGSIAIIEDWVDGGCAETPKEMIQVLVDTAPRSLSFFFDSEGEC